MRESGLRPERFKIALSLESFGEILFAGRASEVAKSWRCACKLASCFAMGDDEQVAATAQASDERGSDDRTGQVRFDSSVIELVDPQRASPWWKAISCYQRPLGSGFW